jgi:hypothetical protein
MMNPAKAAKSVFKYQAPKDAAVPEGLGTSGRDRAELERRFVPIPDRYANPDTTTLTTTVAGAKYEFNIKLDP